MGARNNNASYEDASRTLSDAHSHLRTLLDLTNSPYPSSPPLPTNDLPEDSRRIKRRKLDSDKAVPSHKSIRYGRYGQMEPGQLTMEVVSCDGAGYSSNDYMIENILKNDASLYSAKSYRCSIVLRHTGATTFSLKELTIKSPGVSCMQLTRQGVVFVSMTQDDIFTRTAQYQIQYLPSGENPPGGLPAIYSIRHDDNGPRIRTRNYIPQHLDDDDEEEYKEAAIPSEFTASSSTPFNITYEYGNNRDDEGMPSSFQRSNRRTPNRIGMLPFESDNSDDGADPWAPSASYWLEDSGNVPSYPPMYISRSHDPANMTLDEAREANQIATQEAVRAVGGELMVPLLHFTMTEEKSQCTIKFDPPVTGRFILLKMWTPHHNPHRNIDIQSVVAKGFAGPRYFSSTDVR